MPSRPSFQTVFLMASTIAGAVVIGGALLWGQYATGPPRNVDLGQYKSDLTLADIPFDGEQAYEYLKQLCAIGRRPSGSPGMKQQQQLLLKHFRDLGGKAELQQFRFRHPQDGSWVPMANLIVQWHPERRERILLCAHYDTLPYPLLDPVDRRGRFVGANDGASGVAVLMEMARHMPDLEGRYGVDFVLFDAEEFIFRTDGRYFVGSEYFARQYRKMQQQQEPPFRYRWGVLLDMIGDADLQIFQERYSMSWPETRPLVEQIWATARRLGVREFIPRKGHAVRDDHLPLRNIGRIPTCDVIDFDYPPWHTREDTPDKCSALSLAKVGWVVLEWLREQNGGEGVTRQSPPQSPRAPSRGTDR